MSTTVGDLLIILRADTASFHSGIDEAQKSLADIGKGAQQAASGVMELKRWVEGLAAVQIAEVGLQLANFVKSATESGAQIAEMSRQVGMTASELQTFQVAAIKTGVSQDILNRSIEFFTENIGKLREGLSDPQFLNGLKDVYGSLEAASKSSQTMRPADFAAETIRRTGELTDAYRRNADARALFSRGGQEMGRMQQALAQGFDAERRAAEQMGLVLSDETVKDMEETNTQLSLMGRLLENEVAKGTVDAAKGFIWFAEKTRDAAMGLANILAPAGMSPFAGPAAPEAPAAKPVQPSAPEGGNAPPLIDAEAVKKAQEFAQTYQKLIAGYQLDLDYQKRLGAAYRESAAAVRELEIAHAGEMAEQKLRDAAGTGVAVSEQRVKALRDVASADEEAKKSAADFAAFERPYQERLESYREDIDYQTRLRAAYGQSAEAVRELEIAHAGEIAAQQEWNEAQKGAIAVNEQHLSQIYELAAADEQATLAAQQARSGENQWAQGLEQGLGKAANSLLDVTTKSHGLKSAWQELGQTALNFGDDIEKMILKLAVVNPLINAITGKQPGDQGALPTLDSDKSFGGIFAGADESRGAAGGGLLSGAARGVGGYLGQYLSSGGGQASNDEFMANTAATDLAVPGSAFEAFADVQPTERGEIPTHGGGAGALLTAAAKGIGGFVGQYLSSGNQSSSSAADASAASDDALAAAAGGTMDLAGLATGGDFTVGGGGGVDSQLVAFRATPGERVMVRTPDAADSGDASGSSMALNMTVVTPDANSFRAAQGQILADAYRHMATASRRHS